MGIGADRIQADDFARHLESGHLLAPVFMQHLGFEEAGADGKQGLEMFPAAVKVFAATEGAFQAGQGIELLHLRTVQIDGKAQFTQVAA